MPADAPRDDAWEAALAGTEPQTAQALRDLVADTSYVLPRVVSHLRD